MSLLRVSEISLQERGDFALQHISFQQQEFEKLAIAGETGAGKSTLLQAVAGLAQPQAGTITFDGRRVKGPQEVLVPGHPGVAYLSQHSELPHSLRVEQVLRYASKLPAAESQKLYEVCRISHLLERRTDQVSGGERQRIALARLLLSSPKLLLLDEPFSNLDRGHKQLLKAVIDDIGEELRLTCILVSHDPADTLSWADTLLVLERGRLVQQGPPRQVYAQPATEYVAGLFGDYNLLRGAAATALADLAGLPPRRKPLLIRPENLLLTTESAPHTLPATVRAVRFFGSYSEVDVALLRTRLTVKTASTDLMPGRAVGVALAPAGAWYL
ncbi:ABC transporter ATP-binding protein [Hymenobacter psychrotolerans]|uniref:Iron(III) transport system ATP-binding protein n=1 Tax=Hymenobacter psychrotolerans DSM 18569 TaxID=1121959 RepID=A0A1M6Z2Y1_9BACT|nr:ABC transporter ATP-binding protein [Hymenobacter psychrotolerans]SHL24735.1 iron(III) transport system ATP-binding protein [Hymenobacter psychrotolerans DSM 18569]